MSVRLPALSFGALVVGTVLAVDPGGFAPFGPAKWFVVSTLAFATAAVSLRHGTTTCHRASWWVWVSLLVLLTSAALVNGDAKVALLGQPDRHLGVLTWVLLFAMFCAGQQLADAAAILARAAVVAGAAMGLYALWELLFDRPIAVGTATRRLLGPFGSAAFLGAACCLLGPIAIGIAFDRSEDRRWRWLSGATAVLVAIALIGSGTRAAWFGAAAATVAVVVAVRPSLRNLAICTAGVLVAMAAVAPRLIDVSSRGDSGSRLDEWRVAARVIGRHPLIGVGPEGYRIAVSEGIDAAYEREHRRDTVLPDRAHSGPLDIALAGGLGAAVLYVALLGFVGWTAWRVMRSRRPLAVGVAAAVCAYGAQQLLLFPLAELDPVWWLLSGVVVTVSWTNATTAPPRSLVPALATAMAILMFVAGLLDVAADHLARDALRSTDHDAAVDAARRAVTLRPDNSRYRMVATDAYLNRGSLADVDRAVDEARRALAWSSKDPIAADELATALLLRAALTGDPIDVEAALREWRVLVDRDPQRARWQLRLGRAAALAGDTDVARAAWTIAADLGEPGAAELLAALDASS